MSANTKVQKFIAAGVLAALVAAGSAGTASAQSNDGGLGSITSCSAPGGQQTTGALLGAVLGAVAGNSMSKGDRGAGTALGAVVGGAAGSWMGCKMQRDREQAREDGYAYAADTYRSAYPARYRRTHRHVQPVYRDEVDYYAAPSYRPSYDDYSYGYGR
jgi:hypothetical protein